MMRIFLAAAAFFFTSSVSAMENTPYLYKVLSMENWEASRATDSLKLDDADKEFIHFSLENQVERITSKYWKNVPQFVVLQIDPSKLPGNLVFEANAGGGNKYYHLYHGSIPLESVVDVQIITQKTKND